jgi:hypothetical protein
LATAKTSKKTMHLSCSVIKMRIFFLGSTFELDYKGKMDRLQWSAYQDTSIHSLRLTCLRFYFFQAH